MNPRIRPATDADRPFLQELFATTRAAEVAALGGLDGGGRAFIGQQFAAREAQYRAAYRGAEFSVVEVDGDAVGRLVVDWADVPCRMVIVDVALLPEWRGRGVGRWLVGHLLDEARATQSTVVLHADGASPAARWWQRLGFAVVDEGPVYHRLEWQP